jgi:hypothetical protein
MSLLRRNKSDAKSQAVPAPEAKEAPAKKQGFSLRQWLVDSYNGLYKVVLEPSMPSRGSVLLLAVGLIIGLVWAYAVSPVVFTGANPNRLNQAAQDQWIKMVAGNYARGFYGQEQALDLLSRVDAPVTSIERMLGDDSLGFSDLEALQRLLGVARGTEGTPTPKSPGLIGELLSGWLVPLLLVVVLFPILTLIWRLLIYPNFVATAVMRWQEMRDPALRAKNDAARADLKRLQEQKQELERMKKETVADVELGEPIVQVLKVYSKGRAFDESDEIEDGDDFLGQIGAVIPDSLNGDPMAIEVWLFDMFAAGEQNYKRLFVTPKAASDPAIAARLQSDPDVNLAQASPAQTGAKLVIDSEKLRVQAELINAELGDDGRLNSFRMKMSAWRKSGATKAAPAPAPAYAPSPLPPAPAYAPPAQPAYSPPAPLPPAPTGARPMSAYDDIAFDPPPAPPAPTGARPMSAYDNIAFDPPPAPPTPQRPPQQAGFSPLPPPEDDDPFGSTGDFTPIPRK